MGSQKFQKISEQRKQMEEPVTDADAENAAASCAHKQEASLSCCLRKIAGEKRESGNGAAKEELTMSVFRTHNSPPLSSKHS